MHGMDFEEYIRTANDEIAMIMQIEHKDGITNLEEIVKVDGVDAVFIGPLDLSGSMSITGQMQHPEMVSALDRYLAVCRDNDLAAGMHIIRPNSKNIRNTIGQGYSLVALGLDNVFLDEGAKASLRAAGRQ